MSKILHNPNLEDLRNLIKSAPKSSRQEQVKRIKELPEIKAGLGIQNIESLYSSNIMDGLLNFQHMVHSESSESYGY